LTELRVVVLLFAVGVPLLAAPLTTGLPGGLTVFFVSGIPYGPLLIALLSNRERRTPADAHSQVFALAAGVRSTGAAIGAAIAGWYAPLGSAWIIGGVAFCQIGGAIMATALLGSFRRLLSSS